MCNRLNEWHNETTQTAQANSINGTTQTAQAKFLNPLEKFLKIKGDQKFDFTPLQIKLV